jgi:hypothetical protein
MDLNPYELDFSFPFAEPLFGSSSDDELELTLVVAIEEERLNNERDQHHIVVLFMAEYSSRMIFCKASIGFSTTILLKHRCILPIYFEGDSE